MGKAKSDWVIQKKKKKKSYQQVMPHLDSHFTCSLSFFVEPSILALIRACEQTVKGASG